MLAPIVLLVLSLGLAFGAHRAEARADDRVFDPYYWAHPGYIDPSYDFLAPPKLEGREAGRDVELARDRRGKPPPKTRARSSER